MTLSNMVFIKAGSFNRPAIITTYSSTQLQAAYQVNVDDFWLAQHLVIFEEYDAFCISTGKELPGDEGWGRGKRPVIFVSWYDALAYCNWRSVQEGLKPVYEITEDKITLDWSSSAYRLPANAEWEFAAKGGVYAPGYTYAGSNNLDEVAWYNDNADGQTHPVGQKKANELGLYDMIGNVMEWCWDCYSPEIKPFVKNSVSNAQNEQATDCRRICRGSGWDDAADDTLILGRLPLVPHYRAEDLGFRLARSVGN